MPPARAEDFIRVYGVESRHWMPAYAGMTVKRSFPRKRESRSHTYKQNGARDGVRRRLSERALLGGLRLERYGRGDGLTGYQMNGLSQGDKEERDESRAVRDRIYD